jgi:hypothetical protein
MELYQINRAKSSSPQLVFLVEILGGLLESDVVEVGDGAQVAAHVAAEVLGHLC